jgi:methyltransferase (TIGR00027 family)
MSKANHAIQDVSDTALWVANYRAAETLRPDALFHDPLAQRLVGERGPMIEKAMKKASKYTRFTVVIRTVIIDEFIQNLIQEGVDTVINLGAGLDTRPYRMNLPANLRWIEVDYKHMIEQKNSILENENPTCQLERISLDLSKTEQRRALLKDLSARSQKAVILTEGVLPYLTESQVTELGQDLLAHQNFHYWIAEYMSPLVYPYLKSAARKAKLKNAPFQFFPEEWMSFFQKVGWKCHEIQYFSLEAQRLGRKQPYPFWAYFVRPFMGKQLIEKYQKASGYIVFTPN